MKRPKTRRTTVARRRQPSFEQRLREVGWATTDADEVERRRLRARETTFRIEPLEPRAPLFGSFRVASPSGDSYRVEIRSLQVRVNGCDCPDYTVNGLGTCKHVEAVLLELARGRAADGPAAGQSESPRVEMWLDRTLDEPRVRLRWPPGSRPGGRLRSVLEPFFDGDGMLLADPLDAIPAIERALRPLATALRSKVRLSAQLAPWLEALRRRRERTVAREAFLRDVAAGKRSLEVLELPLYPYQRDGMLHLAFTERALLADEMGLGKTVQAIGACELLRRLRGIERVLVVAPASLKAEWEEQIEKFTDQPSLIVQGPRAARLKQYRQRAFFYLTNYEQIRVDGRDINEILAPDVIVLDEAQRVKNWQAKTAEAVKRLTSRYAFVLTGTPLENRIDEVYSIAQVIDPGLFGPLFRFNREFYELDERGRPTGYKNLDALHRRLRPVMLRRRKAEVEGELPGRTINHYFVPLAPEQRIRYSEYQERVARLAAIAQRRPLTPEEHEQLQRWLACMRMLCDTPYILDPAIRIAPKLEELEVILDEVLSDGAGHKILIFSEWERMLELLRERLAAHGLSHAWHTGSVPQTKRRAEIRRFKTDPDCRLFLSTESGGVGLNLQAADVVINLDLPWNPAKLEQRIARAWRKHQARPVQVINLVAEDTIEHAMLHRLEQKRVLAEGVVDGEGDLTRMDLPSGRAAFVAQVQSLLGIAPTPLEPEVAPLERLRQDSLARWGGRLAWLEVHGADGPEPLVMAVVDRVDPDLEASIAAVVGTAFADRSPRLELLDRATAGAIQRLMAAGVLRPGPVAPQVLHGDPDESRTREEAARAQRREAARERLGAAERPQRMARVLAANGFPREALAPMGEALQAALEAGACWLGLEAESVEGEAIESRLAARGVVPAGAAGLVQRLVQGPDGVAEEEARAWLEQAARAIDGVATALA